ncbi:MAG: hypothetical protein CL609_24105 [Anaerolineaceae bacterium]|nr:hypothetical protein [Anaerolineaceae bacterium]
MAKQKTTQQPSMFKKEIPQMPEGYYSSGPNPNLEKFVAEYSTPYDPGTDEYDVPPFDKPITTTKATAIYNMHTYWSKKPHDAIQEYIKHYTQPGDLVLDPFCGSGGTALAALMEGRKAIAIDLSPAATFITKNYCTPVDTDQLQAAFNQLEAAVKDEMDWLYETRCDRCDGKAITNYTVYSYVFECPRCLRQMPLFDCPEVQIPKKSGGGFKKANVCPYCHQEGHDEEIKAGKTKRFDPIPVLVSYECLDGCKPKKDQRSYNDKNPKKLEYFDRYDLGKIREIESKEIPYWYPPHRMMNVESDTEPWGDEWRLGRNFRTVSELFTKRNLWALALLFDKTKQLASKKSVMLFEITSNILKSSNMMGQNNDGIGRVKKGTYYIPQVQHIINVWNFMKDTLSDFLKGYQQINKLISNDLIISTQTSTSINTKKNSVDYIFTDPPYAGTVQYGELNFIWESWLNYDTSWINKEIIVNSVRKKTEEDWAFQLKKVFTECYMVLKPGRYISLCFHSDEKIWELLQDIMANVGFISEEIDQTLFIDTRTKTENQHTGNKVTKRDLVINFRKPRPGETRAEVHITGEEDQTSFTHKAQLILKEALERVPGSTADHLYDELVSRMVRKGQFERHNFMNLLSSVAEAVEIPNPQGGVTTRWYLLDTVDVVDEAESKKEEAAAERLSRFMTTYLKENPQFEGVHYSDLFEQYLPIKDKPRRLLFDWLPEYFYRTSEGLWRPAQDEAELAQKQNLRSSGALRRVKRFTNALLNSVPPAEKDRPENPATLADWIYQCRRAGLYELGKLLYEQGGLSFETLSETAQLAVQEDYLLCSRRVRQEAFEKENQKQQPKGQKGLF